MRRISCLKSISNIYFFLLELKLLNVHEIFIFTSPIYFLLIILNSTYFFSGVNAIHCLYTHLLFNEYCLLNNINE